MMIEEAKQKQRALQLNRCLIYLISLIAIYTDLKSAYVVALTLWIWLPTVTRAELKIVKNLANIAWIKRIKIDRMPYY